MLTTVTGFLADNRRRVVYTSEPDSFPLIPDRGQPTLEDLDGHFKHWPQGLYRFRKHPDFLAVRERLASKVARLREQC